MKLLVMRILTNFVGVKNLMKLLMILLTLTTKTMEKQCCICRVNFIPTNLNAETRHCCKQCIKELTQPLKLWKKI